MPEDKNPHWDKHLLPKRSSKVIELEADYLAGVWAHYAYKEADFLDKDDIETGMKFFAYIGIDNIIQKNNMALLPQDFTYGTSEQRQEAFSKGFSHGGSHLNLTRPSDYLTTITKTLTL